MAKHKPKTFVGIAEVTEAICGTTGYFYTIAGGQSYSNLRQVGKSLVAMFGNKATKSIKLSVPRCKHLDYPLCHSALHPLSVLEADKLYYELERARATR